MLVCGQLYVVQLYAHSLEGPLVGRRCWVGPWTHRVEVGYSFDLLIVVSTG